MRVGYVDMIGGASGNMLLGAFVDAGADLDHIERVLQTIPVDGWSLYSERVSKRGVAALYLDVVVPGEDHHRTHGRHRPPGRRPLAEIVDLFDRSELTARQRERARAIAVRLAQAEAGASGERVDEMAFHAIGQIDAVIDIAASCIALDVLAIERLFCSSYPVGAKTSRELELLIAGAPSRSEAVDNSMVTTTGAAILATLTEAPGTRPAMRVESVGTGAGRSEFPIPNVLRIEIGTLTSATEPR